MVAAQGDKGCLAAGALILGGVESGAKIGVGFGGGYGLGFCFAEGGLRGGDFGAAEHKGVGIGSEGGEFFLRVGEGLVAHVEFVAQLEEKTYGMAHTIASRSAASIAVAKEALRALVESNPMSPIQFEYVQSLRRNAYFGADYHEGVQAFLEKRAPKFQPTP